MSLVFGDSVARLDKVPISSDWRIAYSPFIASV